MREELPVRRVIRGLDGDDVAGDVWTMRGDVPLEGGLGDSRAADDDLVESDQGVGDVLEERSTG